MAVVESAMAQFLRNQQPRAKTGRFLMPRTRRWFALGFLLATPVLLAQTSAPAPPSARKNGEILDAAHTQMVCFGVLAGNSGPSCTDFGPGPARRADPGRYVETSPGRRADLNRDPHLAAQVP